MIKRTSDHLHDLRQQLEDDIMGPAEVLEDQDRLLADMLFTLDLAINSLPLELDEFFNRGYEEGHEAGLND